MSVRYRGQTIAKAEFEVIQEIQQTTGRIPSTTVSDYVGLTIKEGHLIGLCLFGGALKKKFSVNPKIVEKICRFPYLKGLKLYQTYLKAIPDCIGDLERLEYLSFKDNYLTILPDSICNLHALKWLELCDNYLTDVPIGFHRLQTLESLDLGYNKFTTIPEVIENMKKQSPKLHVSLDLEHQRRKSDLPPETHPWIINSRGELIRD